MSSGKFILTEHTNAKQISDFFTGLDKDKKIRARDLGEGKIELYVRKDSFKQFFTDKLRLDFLVKRDYLKAQNHIFNIIDRADGKKYNGLALNSIKKALSLHKHDFHVGELADDLNGVVNGKLDRIILNGGELEKSDADLIIFDTYTGFRPITSHQVYDRFDSGIQEVTPAGNDNEVVKFKVRAYAQKEANAETETETETTAILGVDYEQAQKIDQSFMDSLYDNIGKIIQEKMREKMKKNTSNSQIFKIHLPILRPFYDDNLQTEQKTMMLRSFAEATQKWARQYPNLEIKVYLPEGISESDMQNIYRDLNKFQGTD